MFLNHVIGYNESLDYKTLPGFDKLTVVQQQRVHEAFERGYLSGKHMGVKIALGKGHETARLALVEEQKSCEVFSDVPPSIFAGLDNCQ